MSNQIFNLMHSLASECGALIVSLFTSLPLSLIYLSIILSYYYKIIRVKWGIIYLKKNLILYVGKYPKETVGGMTHG